MRFAAVATLAFVGAVAAQNSTTTATGCVAKDNACRTTRMPDGSSANQAQCSANNAQCQGDCYAAYNTCRTTPVDGLSANQAQCVSEYATCLGENPVAASGGLISSFIPYSATASSSAAAETTYACNPAHSYPGGQQCVSSNGALTLVSPSTTAAASASMVYMTEVVTALTTVCPAPTAGAYTTTIHSNVYTVSSATTITVTNCPCTVSSKVPAASVTGGAQTGMTTSAAGNGNKNGTASATATQSKPAVYTGAAANVAAGMGFLGAAAGAVMLL
ncbi:hypothetical protein E4T49_06240 [Aureobasidium sp. EXF-10728]|nr:hypothetical protein E4T49_06240 [Aureobasidium sp. EXF-10728]